MRNSIVSSPPAKEIENYRPRFEEITRKRDPMADLTRDGISYKDPIVQQEWIAYSDFEYLSDTAW